MNVVFAGNMDTAYLQSAGIIMQKYGSADLQRSGTGTDNTAIMAEMVLVRLFGCVQ